MRDWLVGFDAAAARVIYLGAEIGRTRQSTLRARFTAHCRQNDMRQRRDAEARALRYCAIIDSSRTMPAVNEFISYKYTARVKWQIAHDGFFTVTPPAAVGVNTFQAAPALADAIPHASPRQGAAADIQPHDYYATPILRLYTLDALRCAALSLRDVSSDISLRFSRRRSDSDHDSYRFC